MRISVAITSALICVAVLGATPAQADFGFLPGPSGFDGTISNQDGSPSTQAGSHPFRLSVGFGFNTHLDSGSTVPDADVKDLQIGLPETLNPRATETTCTESQLESDSLPGGGCPNSAAIGTATLSLGLGSGTTSLYNMTAPAGSSAEFGFDVAGIGLYAHVFGALGGPPGYGFSSEIRDLPSILPITGGSLTIWGNPSDPAHDGERGSCLTQGGSCPVERVDRPLLTLPGTCSGPLTTTISGDSWEQPGSFVDDSFQSHDLSDTPIGLGGCPKLDFSPKVTVIPDSHSSDSPSGLLLDLQIPQSDSASGLAEASLKKSVVKLPEGLTLNPSAAGGLGVCTPAQVDLQGSGPASCPDSSKIGSIEVGTPLLDYPAPGAVYLAAPGDNPFGSLLAIYVVIEDPQSGIEVKFAGEVKADSQTGQLTTVFDNAPKLPFSDLRLNFFGGPRAIFRTPTTCGTYMTTSEIVPWSAANPDAPTPAETATPSSSFQITQGPNGAPCASASGDRPNDSAVSIGTEIPLAGTFSPFSMKVERADGSQEMRRLEISFPPGFTAKLAGIPYCPDASIAAANRSAAAENADPSCPIASRVGHIDLSAGAGPDPIHLVAGVYLAGPYRGAPFSLEVIAPVLSGPFDLGTVLNRTAIFIDQNSAAVHVVTDPFPQVLDGIPADTRSVAVHLDRSGFFLNPTSCNPMTLGTSLFASDSTAVLSNRFQVGGCGALGFSPKLAVDLKGITHRSGHPAFTVTLTQPPGQANIASSVVTLPPSEQVDQGHLRTVCTHTQFVADACPPESIYGQATAISPLLDRPLSGPVYLVSGVDPLPDIGVALRGQIFALRGQISINLLGTVETVKRRLRATFAALPDAPVSQFTLSMPGGRQGLFVNNTNICAHPYRASALFVAQDGATADQRPLIGTSCPVGGKKHHPHKGSHR